MIGEKGLEICKRVVQLEPAESGGIRSTFYVISPHVLKSYGTLRYR